MLRNIFRCDFNPVRNYSLEFLHKLSGNPEMTGALKYDGRTKKRQWEDRRSDQNDVDPKKPKDEAFERIKKRKYALLMGYSGANYYGMQRNPSLRTIEEDLMKALFTAGYISEENYALVQSMQFQRAARTDKGVSAARQVVSLKLPETFEYQKVNDLLDHRIRIFGFRRVTKGFNSKVQCDCRTYIYVMPTVAFANYKDVSAQADFRLTDETFGKLNSLLEKFLGTKNFHNFTAKKKHNDPSAKRYIMSFVCEKPFVAKGVEFAVLKIKGQSFMMHQIRKMVGLTLAVIRGQADENVIDKAFLKDRVNIPRAPGLGLVLDFVHYDRYKNRYADHDSLEWKEEHDTVEEFKKEYIYPTIIDTEIMEKSMVNWLDYLLIHTYDPSEADNNKNGGESGDEEENEEDEDALCEDVDNKQDKKVVGESSNVTVNVEDSEKKIEVNA